MAGLISSKALCNPQILMIGAVCLAVAIGNVIVAGDEKGISCRNTKARDRSILAISDMFA
jgi:hypothetical protein